jgi:K+-dependent Na+/Ca+ exchanger-like protein
MVLNRILSHAFAAAQQVLAPTDGVHMGSDLASSEDTSLMQTGFSYHAFLGAPVCKPAAWERSWGVAVSILLLIYLCVVLVRTCDQYLIPSLEVLCKKWGLPEDVAGVTLLAFGGSFPELAIHTIATIEGSEIGVGTVIGSAVFNVTVGLAVVAFVTPLPVLLYAAPLVRDSAVYVLCLSLILVFFHWGAQVRWWQALTMVLLYFVFVITLILRYQHSTGTGVFSPRSAAADSGKEEEEHTTQTATRDVEEQKARDEQQGNGNGVSPSSPASSDDGGNAAGAAGERRSSLSARRRSTGLTQEEESEGENDEKAGLLSRPSAAASGGSSSSSSGPGGAASRGPGENFTSGGVHHSSAGVDHKQYPDAPKLHHDCEMEIHDYSDNDPNAGFLRKTYYVINWPTDKVNGWIIPNCTLPGFHHLYLRAFILSLVVVLVVSFVLMCIVQYMGCVSGIESAVTGLLVLGVAASLPDIISVGVSARRGLGVMAVSGLVGSNVFDILVGLGFPWLLHMAIRATDHVKLTSGKVYVGSILAVISVVVFGISLVVNRMRLQLHAAWLPCVMYAVYVACVVSGVADPPEEAAKPAFF